MPSSRSAITVWPSANTRISRRPSAATPTSWCIARCFKGRHGPTHSLKETADHISETERNSADAERDSKDVKLYAFLKVQLQSADPPRYPALVIDVRNFGFFVDVPGLAMSGLVHLSSLPDDFYVFDPSRNNLVGRRQRRVIRLGDKVEVQIAKVDSFKKQVDFRLAANRAAGTTRPAKTPTAGPKISAQRVQRIRTGNFPDATAGDKLRLNHARQLWFLKTD